MSTLFELLSRLEAADELDLDLEEHASILQNTQVKIDAYGEVISRYEGEAERYKKMADDCKRRSEIFENEVRRIKAHLIAACKFHNVTQFQGNKYNLKFVSRTLLKAKEQPSAELLKKYPDFCQQTVSIDYKWDMDKLRGAFKTGDEKAKELIEEQKSEYVQFKI